MSEKCKYCGSLLPDNGYCFNLFCAGSEPYETEEEQNVRKQEDSRPAQT